MWEGRKEELKVIYQQLCIPKLNYVLSWPNIVHQLIPKPTIYWWVVRLRDAPVDRTVVRDPDWHTMNKWSPGGSAKLLWLTFPNLITEDRGPRRQSTRVANLWNSPEEIETSFLHRACWQGLAYRHQWVYLAQSEAFEIAGAHFPTFQPSNIKSELAEFSIM